MQWAFAANSAACRRGSGAGGPKPMHLATFHALCRHSTPRVTCDSLGLICCMFRAPESYGSGQKMAGPRHQIDTNEAAQLRRRSRAI